MRIWFWVRAAVVPLLALATIIVFTHNAVAIPTPPRISAAVVAVALAAFVLLADLASLSRGLLQNSCITLATLCLGVAGIEVYAAGPSGLLDTGKRSAGLAPTDPLGSRLPPGRHPASLVVGGRSIYDVVYTVDEAQRRVTRSKPDGPRVVFFGDSWTFGQGVKDSETLPQAFADLTGANVLNYGTNGGSPAQTLRAMELGLFDKDIAGARLFILQTAPFHIPRTSCRYEWTMGAPHYRIVDGKAAYVGPCALHWWQRTGTWKKLLQPLDERINGDQVETYLEIVDRVADLTRNKYHADLLIVDDSWLQPFLMQSRVGFTTKDVEARFKATGAMVIDNETEEKDLGRLELPVDFHPTGLANRLIAKKIAATLAVRRPGLLDKADVAGTPRPAVSHAVEALQREPD